MANVRASTSTDTGMFYRLSILALLTMTGQLSNQGCTQELSKEGQDQKAIHDFLFDIFVEGRETRYVGSGRDRGLKEVTILKETQEIRHGGEVLLPEGAERVWSAPQELMRAVYEGFPKETFDDQEAKTTKT